MTDIERFAGYGTCARLGCKNIDHLCAHRIGVGIPGMRLYCVTCCRTSCARIDPNCDICRKPPTDIPCRKHRFAAVVPAAPLSLPPATTPTPVVPEPVEPPTPGDMKPTIDCVWPSYDFTVPSYARKEVTEVLADPLFDQV